MADEAIAAEQDCIALAEHNKDCAAMCNLSQEIGTCESLESFSAGQDSASTNSVTQWQLTSAYKINHNCLTFLLSPLLPQLSPEQHSPSTLFC
eukprot:5425749-Amphidinium_carterae.1